MWDRTWYPLGVQEVRGGLRSVALTEWGGRKEKDDHMDGLLNPTSNIAKHKVVEDKEKEVGSSMCYP